jgi:predicted AAA+ superfamily ATPase
MFKYKNNSMEKILTRNKRYLQEKKVYFSHQEKITQVVSALNSKKIVIISGVRHSGKSKFLADFLQKTGTQESTFYYNHDLDTL